MRFLSQASEADRNYAISLREGMYQEIVMRDNDCRYVNRVFNACVKSLKRTFQDATERELIEFLNVGAD